MQTGPTTAFRRPKLGLGLIVTALALGAATCVRAQYYTDEAQVTLQQYQSYEAAIVNETGFGAGLESDLRNGTRMPLQVDVPPLGEPHVSEPEVLGDTGVDDEENPRTDSGERLLFIRGEEESLEEYVARGVGFLGLSVDQPSEGSPGLSEHSSDGGNIGEGRVRYDAENVYEELDGVGDEEVQVDEESLVEMFRVFLKSRVVLRKWETKRREEFERIQHGEGGERLRANDDEVDLKEAENKSELWVILSRMYGELVLGVNGPL
ncbi:hypothetical protein FA15DRAFT_671742 [Coprinopsis marcescibilis]|uniref:Uncharacterized protein n=1 Tax=Coprinopsis marcescibilis TaxID=230819 RepID=A0A5C3KPJ8_COPMA|nr:hypothetical protein FA15DRAFT_671742 [Coprinopsis marcescibilis]